MNKNSIKAELHSLFRLDMLPSEVKGLGLMKAGIDEVTSAEIIEALNQNLEISQGILGLLKNSLRQEAKQRESGPDICKPITLESY